MIRKSRGKFSKHEYGHILNDKGHDEFIIIEKNNGRHWASWDSENQRFIIIYKNAHLVVKYYENNIKFQERVIAMRLCKVSFIKVNDDKVN